MHYVAPEVVLQLPYHGPQADVWSCGVIFFTMVAGYLPFEDDSGKSARIFNKILNGAVRVPSDLSEQCKNLLQRLLHRDPESRITIQEIKKHAFTRIMRYY